jgi:hypothetical protein
MSRNIIHLLMYRRRKFLDLISFSSFIPNSIDRQLFFQQAVSKDPNHTVRYIAPIFVLQINAPILKP